MKTSPALNGVGLFLLTMENIKLNKYLLLDEHDKMYYANVFRYAKAVDTIGEYQAKKLTGLPFGEVTMVKNLAAAADYIKVFEIVFGISEEELSSIRVMEFFMALNWVRYELGQLVEREEHLVGGEDPKMIEAGSAQLNVFKEMNILIPLSKEYSKTPEEIAAWKYSTVFTILYHEKVRADIEREYNRLTAPK